LIFCYFELLSCDDCYCVHVLDLSKSECKYRNWNETKKTFVKNDV